jgi:hypothetical protein
MQLSFIFNMKKKSPSLQHLSVSAVTVHFLLHVKLQSVSYNFDIADYEYGNQTALSPTFLKGEGINLKNYVCNEKVIIGS